jgi:hypothetical protein
MMSIVEVHQQQQDTNGNGSNNACVLPQLRGLVRFLWVSVLMKETFHLGQSQRPAGRTENDFLPQELMLALRQTALPNEYLGPPAVINANKFLRPLPTVEHLC